MYLVWSDFKGFFSISYEVFQHFFTIWFNNVFGIRPVGILPTFSLMCYCAVRDSLDFQGFSNNHISESVQQLTILNFSQKRTSLTPQLIFMSTLKSAVNGTLAVVLQNSSFLSFLTLRMSSEICRHLHHKNK